MKASERENRKTFGCLVGEQSALLCVNFELDGCKVATDE